MNPHVTQRIFLATALSAVLLFLLAFAIWGAAAAVGAAVAGGLAAANWGAIKVLSTRVAEGRFSKNGFMVALAFKSGVLMLLCWLCITRFGATTSMWRARPIESSALKACSVIIVFP